MVECSLCKKDCVPVRTPVPVPQKFCKECWSKAMKMFGGRARSLAGRRSKFSQWTALSDARKILGEVKETGIAPVIEETTPPPSK